MRKNKVTQIQTIFYRLWKHHQSEKRDEFIPIFEFIGELYIEELGVWGFMSYELPARFADLKRENPNLLEHRVITGRSGAKYYAYRFAPNPSPDKIIEQSLFDFYKKIKTAYDSKKAKAKKENCAESSAESSNVPIPA